MAGPVSTKTLGRSTGLTTLYISALSLVGFLLILGVLLVQSRLDRQVADARVINLAGRQRMLSQKLSRSAS